MTEKIQDSNGVSDGVADFEIVVAHYNEDLSWLHPLTGNAIVYSKGNPPHPESIYRNVIKLPNIGRESHTILYHIVTRYDSLSNITLFVQGEREGGDRPHTTFSITEMRDKAFAESPLTMTTFEHDGSRGTFEAWNGMNWTSDPPGILWLSAQKSEFLFADCTPSEFWVDIFGYKHPEKLVFAEAAFFAVSAATIRRRPLSFYKKLLDKFEKPNHINPEIGHFMERFWGEIFLGRIGPDCAKSG